jgi:hypothetical protein
MTATTPMTGKTTVTTAAKPEVKSPATGVKTDVHGMNADTAGHAKTTPSAKTVEAPKS